VSAALEKLRRAQHATGSLLSIGLEPCPEYQFGGLPCDVAGYEVAMRLIVEATAGLACAYKLNVAFFEALGPEGIALLHRVRALVPADVLLIADAKRSDIGSSARRYAQALYGSLAADSVTVNPLMGHDSVEPFLAHDDRLTFLLCLTSNPGACDFLVPHDLHLLIAEKALEWDAGRGVCGLVVGATRPERAGAIRHAAGTMPFLVPGLGAQGGSLAETIRAARVSPDNPGLVLHVTRGVLPDTGDTTDPVEAIRAKTRIWNEQIAAAARSAGA
jgi:orotidine-5'-phosphate decarboxylase